MTPLREAYNEKCAEIERLLEERATANEMGRLFANRICNLEDLCNEYKAARAILKSENKRLDQGWHNANVAQLELEVRLAASLAREEAYRSEVVKLSGELAKAQQSTRS